MCGFAGVFDTVSLRAVQEGVLLRMNEAQSHRGPDEGGLHVAPGLGLAHRRLSIVDRAAGSQPMQSEDGKIVVVFNGEIYNHRELARALTSRGHRFVTRCDTEAIIHAWREWGEACVETFRGMFAFALWDADQQTVFLARDRMGVKPLHYALLPDGWLIFGSELKALLAHGQMPRTLDPLALEEYFALGYVADPRCIFSAAKKLAPGHTLSVVRGMTDAQPRQYWDVRFSPGVEIDAARASTELAERLAEAVSIRLESEVPLGAFLSGGVDSSAVVAAISAATGGSPFTCSIGFGERGFDESDYASQVAKVFGTRHVAERAGCHDTLLIDTLAHAFDEPFADSSAMPTYRVCELARRHVTVALSGDGADECFGGYRRYRDHLQQESWRTLLPLGVRRPLFSSLSAACGKWPSAPGLLRAGAKFQSLAQDAIGAYVERVSLMPGALRERLFSPAMRSARGEYRVEDLFRAHAAKSDAPDALSLVQYLDFKTYLPGDINTKVDRTSMAHSLEVREPMMDHRLVEWAAQLPATLKIRDGHSKWLLKKTLEPVLPHAVLYRPKMGFAVPLGQWLRGPAREQMEESVLSARMTDCGWFDPATLRELADDHTRGTHDRGSALWALMMFDAFLKRLG